MESNFCVPMVDIVRSSMKELATVLVILLAELLDIMSYVVCVCVYIYISIVLANETFSLCAVLYV